MIRTIHDTVKGRVRFKVTGLYRTSTLKIHLETLPQHQKGITAVRANIVTGTVLIHYSSPLLGLDQIRQIVLNTVTAFRKQLPAGNTKNRRKSSTQLVLKKKKTEKITGASGSPLPPVPSPQAGILSPSQNEDNWYARDVETLLDKFSTPRYAGLSYQEVQRRQQIYGPNALPEAAGRSGLRMFIEQFETVPVALLAAAAGVSVLTGGIVDAAAIMGVVVMNSIIGYVTESRSEKTIQSLKNLVHPHALVLRDGKVQEVDASEIVPGDMLVLRPGRYVGADARTVDALRLSIDESALTGESMPVDKTPEQLTEGYIPLSDRHNMCYMGTLVTGGQGTALVVATGQNTEMGKIQSMVGEAETPETPMSRQLDEMGTQMVVLSSGLCGLVFLVGLIRGYGILEMLKTAISLAVAAVPEGLPAVATTTLALGIHQMRKRGVLIRNLGAIEAIGSSQVICLDKTGTLTLNKMTIVQVYAGKKHIQYSKNTVLIELEKAGYSFEHELPALVISSVLCNESELSKNGTSVQLNGSPTENALLTFAMDNEMDIHKVRRAHPLQKTFHRSESRNFMASIHTSSRGSQLVAVKGSPSEVLDLCDRRMTNGRLSPLFEEEREAIQLENDKMAADALRVLGFAFVHIESETDPEEINDVESFVDSKMIWLGLVGMADPIREGVEKLIADFHRAGIKTVMITGDQSATAYTVGRTLQLNGDRNIKILDSTSLASMPPDKMVALCQQTNIFARVSPANKLQIVKAFQEDGKVVAMTGDGINDGPALKKADIGVAMGHTGTDVAREIADVVIEDDRIEIMLLAVEQGRTIYVNVRKALHFLLATNLSEIVVSFTANVAGLGQPLTQMQLLWINMITDIFPGLALSLEPVEGDIMQQPPRDPNESIIRPQDMKKIISDGAVISAGAMGGYGYGIMRYGIGPQAGSIAFLSLTIGQLLHALHCRSENHGIFDKGSLPPNKYLNLALGGSFALQLLAMFTPGLRSLLGISRIGLTDAAVIGISATLPLLVNNALKDKKKTARNKLSSGRSRSSKMRVSTREIDDSKPRLLVSGEKENVAEDQQAALPNQLAGEK